MREINTIEEMRNLIKNYNICVKGCLCSNVIPYIETTFKAKTFDRDFNKFKININVSSALIFVNKMLLEYSTKVEELKKLANSYNIPCLKKEQDKILNKLFLFEKKVDYYSEMKEFFNKFNSLENDEIFFNLLKYKLLRL